MDMFAVIVWVALICAIVNFVYIGYKIRKDDDEQFSLSVESMKIRYLADITPLKKTLNGDWIDLRCAEDTAILKGQYKAIPLGVAIKLPSGYEAMIAPRSSTFKNHGIMAANGVGIVDESYCGDNDEWHFLAYATRDTFIKKDERICQFRAFKHMDWMNLEKVVSLDAPDRGGIGSTGRM